MSKQLILMTVSVAFFVATAIINIMSTSSAGINGNSQTDLSDKYPTPITPPGFAFAIWGPIYIWQSLWLLFMLILAILKRAELKESGKVTFGALFYSAWCVSCIGNGAWVIFFAYEEQTVCLVALTVTAISLYAACYESVRYVGFAQIAKVSDNETMKQNFPSYEVSSDNTSRLILLGYKILINNGLTFYVTWVTVATFGLGLALFWIYVGDADKTVTSLFCLGVLTVIVAVYLFLDLFYLRRWLIDVYAPYPVLLWALSLIATKPSSDDLPADSPIRTWCFVLVGVAAVALLAKIISATLWYSKGGLTAYLSNKPGNAPISGVNNNDYQTMSQL